MVAVHTVFDCKHEQNIEIQIENDVEIPDTVRGLGKCPACKGEDIQRVVPVPGVAFQPASQKLAVDSILMMQLEG